MKKEKILISSCLLGNNVRYNAKILNKLDLSCLKDKVELIPFCPEVASGLPIPRLPSEIKNNKVINIKKEDWTSYFINGANLTLKLVKKLNIKYAILKDKSPSCGVYKIYDGSFQGKLIDGNGFTCKLLKENNIKVYSENEIEKLIIELKISVLKYNDEN